MIRILNVNSTPELIGVSIDNAIRKFEMDNPKWHITDIKLEQYYINTQPDWLHFFIILGWK